MVGFTGQAEELCPKKEDFVAMDVEDQEEQQEAQCVRLYFVKVMKRTKATNVPCPMKIGASPSDFELFGRHL